MKKPDRKEIISWRPLKLTNARVVRIHELTGFDAMSEEGFKLLRSSGTAAMLKISHALLSIELHARGISRDEYLDALETLDEINAVYNAAMVQIALFYQSHAPQMKAAVAALIGGTGAMSTDSPPSPESKTGDATRFES